MKIAISASGKDLDTMINPRFCRCDYFLIADTDTDQLEAYANENMGATGGAGIQSATFVISKGAQAVITGSAGPNASGVQMITGHAGSIRQAVEQFKEGHLAGSPTPPRAESYIGTGTTPPMSGAGRGMGRGGGRGMCGGGRSRRQQ